MGNHTAGNAMGKTAQALVANRPADMTALAILDMICESYRGCDAEFEAEHPTKRGYAHPDFSDWRDPHPGAGLGALMVEAFAPNGIADLPRYAPALAGDEDVYDLWYDEVCIPFRKRYEFC